MTSPNSPTLNAAVPTALAMAAALVSRGGPYLALLITARLLSPEQFGAYALAAVTANLAGALVSGGGALWTNRYATADLAASRWRDGVRQRYLQIVFALAAAVLAAALVVLASVPGEWRSLIVAAAAAAILVGLAEAVFSLLRSTGQVTPFFLLRDLAIPLSYLALLALVLPATAAAALGLLPIAGALPLLIGAIRLRRLGLLSGTSALRCRGARLRKLWGHTASLIANNLAGRLAAYVDIFVLAALVSASWVGEYQAAAQLALGFVVVQNAVFLGLPWQLRDQGSAADRADRTGQIIGRQRLLVGPAAVALIAILVFAPEILALFGPHFVAMATLLRLLCLIRFFDLLWGPQQQILISNGLARQDARASLLGIVIWLAGFAVLQEVLATLPAAVAAHGLASPAAQLMRWQALRSAGLSPPLAGALALNAVALCYAGALIMTYLLGA